MRSIACLVLVVACTNKPAPTPTPAPVASAKTDERAMTVVIETCLPVGYGEHCSGTIDGRAISLQACVGREGDADLMHRLSTAPIPGQDGGAPITIAVQAKPVGVLDAAYSSDYCGGLLFADTKEQFHVLRVVR